MMQYIHSLLANHPIEFFIITFIIALAYFGYIFYWAKKENEAVAAPLDAGISIPHDHAWYLFAKEYKPRAFLIKMLEWVHTDAIDIKLDEDGNFIAEKKADLSNPLYKKLFAKRSTIDFGPYINNRSLAQAIKAHKKEIKAAYKDSFSMQWFPFIGGLILSALPVLPLLYNEIILWAPVFALMAYLNYRAFHELHFYTQTGKKQRAHLDHLIKELKKPGNSQEDLGAQLTTALAFEKETDLAKKFKHLVKSAGAKDSSFNPLWFVHGYFEPDLGKQLIQSLSLKKYK